MTKVINSSLAGFFILVFLITLGFYLTLDNGTPIYILLQNSLGVSFGQIKSQENQDNAT